MRGRAVLESIWVKRPVAQQGLQDMKIKHLSVGAAFAAAILTGSAASADVITFDTLPQAFYASATTLTEFGYNIAYTPTPGAFGVIGNPAACTPACASDGTNAFYSFNTGSLTISATDGAPISITALDAAQTFTMSDRVLDFTVTGLTESATTVSQEFTTAAGGADSFQTFNITTPGFTDLVSFTIAGVGSYPTTEFAVDNLVVSGGAVVPEPATWAVLLAGFGGIGAAMRSRRKLAAA